MGIGGLGEHGERGRCRHFGGPDVGRGSRRGAGLVLAWPLCCRPARVTSGLLQGIGGPTRQTGYRATPPRSVARAGAGSYAWPAICGGPHRFRGAAHDERRRAPFRCHRRLGHDRRVRHRLHRRRAGRPRALRCAGVSAGKPTVVLFHGAFAERRVATSSRLSSCGNRQPPATRRRPSRRSSDSNASLAGARLGLWMHLGKNAAGASTGCRPRS